MKSYIVNVMLILCGLVGTILYIDISETKNYSLNKYGFLIAGIIILINLINSSFQLYKDRKCSLNRSLNFVS
ncbi:hypothetical protein CEB3_c01080 [Peptococcaceae bacterium CEB3]|nr:hypothetical protein CEB3_c01080 [Peptococcaceae bacterium CEB3]